MANFHSLNGLPEAPSENHKIHGFCAALEDDDQWAASCKLPIGDASAGILADIDDRVLSTSSGMRSLLRELSYALAKSKNAAPGPDEIIYD